MILVAAVAVVSAALKFTVSYFYPFGWKVVALVFIAIVYLSPALLAFAIIVYRCWWWLLISARAFLDRIRGRSRVPAGREISPT
jgi:hypothetical protein